MQAGEGRTCLRCGEHNKPHFNFCWKCGTSLAKSDMRYPRPRRRSDWRAVFLVAALLAGGYVATEHGSKFVPHGKLPSSPAQDPANTRTEFQDRLKPTAPPSKAAPEPLKPTTATFWTQDRPWAQSNGWTIYATNQVGCFAQKVSPDGSTMVLGGVRGSGDVIVAMTIAGADLLSASDRTMTILFDGTRRWQPYFQSYQEGVTGRFGRNAGFVEEIAKSARLEVIRDKTPIADFPLEGTRAALSAVSACLEAIEKEEIDQRVFRDHENALPRAPLCDNKPSNGQLLAKRRGKIRQGHKVTIRNSGEGDAIVKMRGEPSKNLAYSFFVHRNQSATIAGVADGEYRIQFAYGRTLLEGCADYENPIPNQFDKTVMFETRVQRTKKQITTYTSDYSATLYAVVGGNAPTSKISSSDFLGE